MVTFTYYCFPCPCVMPPSRLLLVRTIWCLLQWSICQNILFIFKTPFGCLLFLFFISPRTGQNVWVLKSPARVFFSPVCQLFLSCILLLIFKKSLPTPRLQWFFSHVSSMSFIVLGFTFRIHFARYGSKFIFFCMCISNCFSPFVENTICSQLNCLCTLSKIIFICVGFISGLSILFHGVTKSWTRLGDWTTMATMLVLHCLDDCCFINKSWNQIKLILQVCSFSKFLF